MLLVFVRNVKFSAAECNSFNMRKKNIGDLASKKIIGGSHAKKQLLECKEAGIKIQSGNFRNVKKQASRYKEATFGVQSYNNRDAIPNIFISNLKYLIIINAPLYTDSSHQKLHKYTV